TLSPPIIHAQVFHPGEELYTLLMVNPDFPNLRSILPYIPPHPPCGSPINQYTILFFKQQPSQDSSSLFLKFDTSKVQRDQFSVREIDEPIYGEEKNAFEKFRSFIDLPSSENIDKNERLRRMGPRKRIENEKLPLNYQHPCAIPWKLAVKNQKDE
ncbi:hypothetical protein BY996DRAFT_4595086, partial [Phakopsora pachyrhizi]